MRAGLKSTSEQAAIVARYADLFTPEQLEVLRDEAAQAVTGVDGRERLYRLRKTCEAGVIAASIAPLQDALQNAELAAQVEYGGETLPLRTASARVGVLPEYADREALGKLAMDAAAELNDRRHELKHAREALRAKLSGESDPVRRSEEEKGVVLAELARAFADASTRPTEAYDEMRTRWLDRLLGADRPLAPSSYHAPYVYRLSALAGTYSKERATEVCLATLRELGFDLEAEPNIQVDLEDRPQKTPRPAVIPADPPKVVHLITRAQGGLQDYQGLLHEAGHALHFAGCDPSLPYAFRKLSRDNALTEIYSYAIQSVVREPEWHARHFGLSAEDAADNAEAARFSKRLSSGGTSRSSTSSSSLGAVQKDGGTRTGYAERLTEGTGFTYRPDRYLADMDPDFYSADYLRAAVRSAQLRSHLRENVGANGGGARRPGTSCAASSAKGSGRRTRRSRSVSGSMRSTPSRSSPSSRLSMKLIRPLVSRTAHSTRSSDPIPSCRAAASTSPSVIRFRARFRWIGSPSWTTMTGSPSSTGRRKGSLKLR